ncbi:MAG TPA: VOC family protein [Candidatus Obscuribacterales bacterium]
MIRGLNHVTLAIGQLDRSIGFYQDILGCRLLARWPKGAYLLAGDLWLALVVDARTRSGPLPEYTHFAFDVASADFADLSQRILAAEAVIWKDNVSEGDSLYFLDPDGHKLEIHATSLLSRLQSAGQAPWEGLEIMAGAAELAGQAVRS